MKIIEVNTKKTKKEFLQVPLGIYKNVSNWIRPLDKDIEDVFDPTKNKYFRHGEAIRWILKDEKGDLIGRVAAFINKKTAKTSKQLTGGMGFFECIEDKKASFLLFDTCKAWLEERGMEAMDGPINFGERDKWWGLLVEGFTEPNYCMPYHHPYYKHFFEDYEFKLYFKQYTYSMRVDTQLSEKYYEKAERIAQDPGYHFEHISKKNIEKYAEDFRIVYNKAWVKHTGVREMPKAQALSLIKKMKPILDEDIIWFAYYHDDPIGFFIMIPELNQIFKHLNGKLNWIGKLIFLWHKWRGTCRKIFGVVFGIVPEHQGKGLEGAIIVATAKKIQPMKKYEILEMNWIGDFNPKMQHVTESLGAKIVKTHITYRKLFDHNAPFERYPIIE